MSRYIDAEKCLKEHSMIAIDWQDLLEDETLTPTADVVGVVRCKHCKSYDNHDYRCKFFNHGVLENDYCSRVIERREDE